MADDRAWAQNPSRGDFCAGVRSYGSLAGGALVDRDEVIPVLALVGHIICDFSEQEDAKPFRGAIFDGKIRVRFLNIERIEKNAVIEVLNKQLIFFDGDFDMDDVFQIVGVAMVDRMGGEFLKGKNSHIGGVRRQIEWGQPAQCRIQSFGEIGEVVFEFQLQVVRTETYIKQNGTWYFITRQGTRVLSENTTSA